MAEFANSPKQQEIMKLVCDAAAHGRRITVNELMTELSYKPQRKALHCSLGFLKKHGFINKENHGRAGCVVVPTVSGMAVFKPAPALLP